MRNIKLFIKTMWKNLPMGFKTFIIITLGILMTIVVTVNIPSNKTPKTTQQILNSTVNESVWKYFKPQVKEQMHNPDSYKEITVEYKKVAGEKVYVEVTYTGTNAFAATVQNKASYYIYEDSPSIIKGTIKYH